MKTPLTKEITWAIMQKNISIMTRSLKEFVVKIGSDTRLFDVINWHLQKQNIIGYEIKISKRDFMKLKDKIKSVDDFTRLTDRFFVVVPTNLLNYAKEKLNAWNKKEIGIITYDVEHKKLITKKQALRNNGWLMDFAREEVLNQLEKEWVAREHKQKIKRQKDSINVFLTDDSEEET